MQISDAYKTILKTITDSGSDGIALGKMQPFIQTIPFLMRNAILSQLIYEGKIEREVLRPEGQRRKTVYRAIANAVS